MYVRMKHLLAVILVLTLILVYAPMLPSETIALGEEDFTYSINWYSESVIITGYFGSGGNVVVPATIDGYPVVQIFGDTFVNSTTLTSLTIPDSVKYIYPAQFIGCSNLSAVNVNLSNPNYSSVNGVLYSKDRKELIFYPSGKTNTSFMIPEGVEFSGYFFTENPHLIDLTIPSTMTYISVEFKNCMSLENIEVAVGNPSYSSKDGILFSKSQSTLIRYPNAHSGTSYSVPSSIEAIGEFSFAQNTNLQSVTLPTGVKDIGMDAYYGCESLSDVTLPGSLLEIGPAAFERCTSLSSIQIPKSVTHIAGFTSCGLSAFYDCTNLETIQVEDGNTSFKSIEGVLFNSDQQKLYFYPPSKLDTSYSIPNTVRFINESAFMGNTRLTSVQIPNSVQSIGSFAFENCMSLTRVILPESVKNLGYAAFRGCTSLHTAIYCGDSTSGSYPPSTSYTFDNCADDFQIRYFNGRTAFETPIWGEYWTYPLQGTIQYAVTYQPNGATGGLAPVDGLKYTSGKYAVPKTAGTLVKTGLAFAGWNTKADGSGDLYYPGFWAIPVIDSNVNLYAQWTNGLVVLFDCKGGSNVPSQKVMPGSHATLPETPSKKGHTFIGWYQEDTGLSLWDFTQDVVLRNITLYARWSTNWYPITFNSNGGDIDFSYEALYNSYIFEPDVPVKSGYTFVGWFSDPELTDVWDFYSDLIEGPTTLYAKWILNSFHSTVTFESNGGSTIEPKVIVINTLLTAPTTPTRTGYTFAGWYKDEALTTAWNFSTMKVVSDLTLYAKWTPKSYTVTFNSNGGTAVASKSVPYNTTVPIPTSPTKVGYSFAGWFKDVGLTSAWDFATDKVLGAMTLYAKWTPGEYTVTYNSNGGSAIAPVKAFYNTKLTAPTAPTREGYTFVGWYKDTALTSLWTFTTNVVTKDMTLYAKWKPLPYTVTFLSNGGTAVASKIVNYDAKIIAPTAPTRTGWTFIGWYRESDFATPWVFATDVVKGPTTLYAKWQIAVKFVSKGGPVVDSVYLDAPGAIFTLPTPMKTGYQFLGWYKDSALTKPFGVATETISTNLTLYAKWQINQYQVTFESNGGSDIPGKTAIHNTNLKAPKVPVKANYKFTGWYKDTSLTTAWNFKTMKVVAPMTLYAKWTPIS